MDFMNHIGEQKMKTSQLKMLSKAGVYVNGDKLMFNYKKGKQQ